MEKYLIVVDMQEDFVYRALGTQEARAIVPALIELVRSFEGKVVFTQDTHDENYMDTQEGKFLPVPHCIRGTAGWELIASLREFCRSRNCAVFEKPTFGSVALAAALRDAYARGELAAIELCGVCTDICVLSNALLLKAYMPEVPISLHTDCCAGVTPQKHEAALEAMRSCQIAMEA